MNRLIVLIPAYLPDDKFLVTVRQLRAAGFAVLAVDDGSGPGCAALFAGAEELGCRLLGYPENRGKGYALKTGIRWAAAQGYTHLVTADADGQHSPEDIGRLAQEMERRPDALVLGSRDPAKMPPRSQAGNRLTAFLFRLLYGIRLQDTQTGLRGIPLGGGRAEKLCALAGDRYEFETAMLIAAPGLFDRIRELPVETIYIDNNASSHFHPLRDGLRIYRLMFGRFPAFLASSLAAFGIDYLLFNLLVYLAHLPSPAATLAARPVSAGCNYLINRRLVFRGGRGYTPGRYALLALGLLAANCALIWALTGPLRLAPWLAKLLVELLLYLVSFTVQSRMAGGGAGGRG